MSVHQENQKLLVRLKWWCCQVTQTRISHPIQTILHVQSVVLKVDFDVLGKVYCMIHSSWWSFWPCRSNEPCAGWRRVLLSSGQDTVTSAHSFVHFFIETRQTSARKLGKGPSRVFCTHLILDLCFRTFVSQALLYSPEHPHYIKVPPLLG